MGDKEWRPASVLDVFADPVARVTLAVANLLGEHQRIDAGGNQHTEYETVPDEVTVVENEGDTVDLRRDRDLTDDFEAMWSDIESTSHRLDSTPHPESALDGETEGGPT